MSDASASSAPTDHVHAHAHAPATVRHRRAQHEHLWHLADGTPVHVPPATLTADESGSLACHLCGRWFRHLGLHVRAHGYTADDYRDAVGLTRNRPLCATGLSAGISRRQQARYLTDATVREHFHVGQELARTGALTATAIAAAQGRRARRQVSPQELQIRRDTLAAGRRTMAAGREERLRQLLVEQGLPDLASLLRARATSGDSVEGLRALTGLGRSRLRRELLAAGLAIPATGRNRPQSLAAKAERIDAVVAARLGLHPSAVRDWLVSERDRGRTLASLAAATGRSQPWVRSRVNGRTTTSTPPLTGTRSVVPVRSVRDPSRRAG